MPTSGTIGSTVIDTAKVLDHAVRRCGLSPSTLTPEQIDMALDNLYLILTSIINRGVNLWCIDRQLIGLQLNQAAYNAPSGTIDVLDISYRTGAQLAHTGTTTSSSYTAVFTSGTAVKTVGMYFSVSRTCNFVFEASNDGTTWSTIKVLPEFTGFAGTWFWYDIDPSFATAHFRIRETVADTVAAPVAFAQVVLIRDPLEVQISSMNRDTYNSLPSKNTAGRPDQYLFDKQIDPKIVLYPVPNDVYGHLVVTRHRYIQDIGSLQDKLEIPERWFEAIIWMLAKNCAFELPDVKPDRLQLCMVQAEMHLSQAEDGETDGSPFYMQPKISGYTA